MAFTIKSLTFDAKPPHGRFRPSPSAEREFQRQLKKVAQVSSHLIDQHLKRPSLEHKGMQEELTRYSQKLGPWAERQAQKMFETVANANKRAYTIKSRALGRALSLHVAEAPVGRVATALLNEQVGLITSIPLEAGLRAQAIAQRAFFEGLRAKPDLDVIQSLEEEMGFSTEAAVNRAVLIARTETARANAMVNQARAQAVGSAQYRWHNSGDESVRESHRKYRGKRLQGMIFSWDDPPTLDDGMTGHPGTFPNCRCFAEPLFDDE